MDSSEKIVNCFNGAAQDVGVAKADSDQVKSYIGLGLHEAFSRLYPSSCVQQINQLVSKYREYWIHIDNTPMPMFANVERGLSQLNEMGYLLSVATGKSRAGLNRVFDEIDLNSNFVYTRCADESRTKPNPQMLFDILGFAGLDKKDCIMIGDTTFDMEMAAAAEMDALGVSWGSHSPDLLDPYSVSRCVDDFDQLVEFFKH